MNQQVKVAIGLGSNLGERMGLIKSAARILAFDFLEECHISSIFESKPMGFPDQGDFLNAVMVGVSEWKPPAIVNFLKNAERELGRKETVKNGPRLIDLDLLAYGEELWTAEGVTVPHPRMLERDFVLLPFKEVWGQWTHPSVKMSVGDCLTALKKRTDFTAKIVSPPPNFEY